jgi:hypothetical protein
MRYFGQSILQRKIGSNEIIGYELRWQGNHEMKLSVSSATLGHGPDGERPAGLTVFQS